MEQVRAHFLHTDDDQKWHNEMLSSAQYAAADSRALARSCASVVVVVVALCLLLVTQSRIYVHFGSVLTLAPSNDARVLSAHHRQHWQKFKSGIMKSAIGTRVAHSLSSRCDETWQVNKLEAACDRSRALDIVGKWLLLSPGLVTASRGPVSWLAGMDSRKCASYFGAHIVCHCYCPFDASQVLRNEPLCVRLSVQPVAGQSLSRARKRLRAVVQRCRLGDAASILCSFWRCCRRAQVM